MRSIEWKMHLPEQIFAGKQPLNFFFTTQEKVVLYSKIGWKHFFRYFWVVENKAKKIGSDDIKRGNEEIIDLYNTW